MMAYADSLAALEAAMISTQQTKGLNVLEHGKAVYEAYLKLDAETCPLYDKLIRKVVDFETLKRYQVYHDCGKPFCADGEGRFPDHAYHSSMQWNHLFPAETTVRDLMALDMCFHAGRSDEIVELWKNPLAPTLYLTAWAEIYANANMFGGTDSNSFKIKRKRLIQAGKKFLTGD